MIGSTVFWPRCIWPIGRQLRGDGLAGGELPSGFMLLALHDLELAATVPLLEVVPHLAEVRSPMPRRKASRMMSRSSVTASRSKPRSLAKVTASCAR